MNRIETTYLHRVPLNVARRLYNEGQTVLIVPCNIHPENVWGIGSTVSNQYGHTWEEAMNGWHYYHDSLDRSAGRYPAFYVKKERRNTPLSELKIGDVFRHEGCDYTLGFFFLGDNDIPMVHVTNHRMRQTEDLPETLEVEVLLK